MNLWVGWGSVTSPSVKIGHLLRRLAVESLWLCPHYISPCRGPAQTHCCSKPTAPTALLVGGLPPSTQNACKWCVYGQWQSKTKIGDLATKTKNFAAAHHALWRRGMGGTNGGGVDGQWSGGGVASMGAAKQKGVLWWSTPFMLHGKCSDKWAQATNRRSQEPLENSILLSPECQRLFSWKILNLLSLCRRDREKKGEGERSLNRGTGLASQSSLLTDTSSWQESKTRTLTNISAVM